MENRNTQLAENRNAQFSSPRIIYLETFNGEKEYVSKDTRVKKEGI